MSNKTNKSLSERDAAQTNQISFNDVDGTFSTGGFLTGVVGRKIQQAISTTSVTGDTSTYTFSENGTTLYVFQVIYTDSTQSTLISATRIS